MHNLRISDEVKHFVSGREYIILTIDDLDNIKYSLHKSIVGKNIDNKKRLSRIDIGNDFLCYELYIRNGLLYFNYWYCDIVENMHLNLKYIIVIFNDVKEKVKFKLIHG